VRTPEKIAWTEGMLIAPQHLQNQDRYHEVNLAESISLVLPITFGVYDLKIDGGGFASGGVRISRLVGRLPDGTLVHIGADGGAAPLARNTEGHFPANQRMLEVFVGVARDREGVPLFATPQGGEHQPRYTMGSRHVLDAAGSGSAVDVGTATPCFVMLFGDEDRGEFECVKVAEIVRDKNGSLALNERYVPPCLRIGASDFVLSSIRQLLALLVAKQRDLAASLRQGKGSSVEFNAGDVTRYLRLSAFNSIIPILRHLADTPDIAPMQAYLHLVEFYGRLCTFEIDADPSEAPAFRHADLGGTFEEVFARIIALLQLTTQALYLQIPLETRDGIWFGRFDDEKILSSQLIFAIQNKNLPEQQIADRLPRLSKISSANGIFPMIRVATLGVPLQFLPQPPPAIPVRAGVVYFNVNQQDPNWAVLAREKTIGLFLPPPFDPSHSKVELLAIPRATR
jgi:type VI secretion system protein ImpJ